MDEPSLDPIRPEDLEAAERAAMPASARMGASTTRALATAGLIVTIASILSRVLGYVRYVVIARAVSNTGSLDAFIAAFRIPDFLFQLVAAGALGAALIPVMAALLARGETARAWRVASTIATLLLGTLVVLVVVVGVLAPVLVPVITPGFGGAQMATMVQLTQIMLLSPLFLAAGAIATTTLNAKGRFLEGAVAPLAYNTAIILGALFLVPVMGVAGLAVGVVIGAAGNVVVQLPGLVRAGARIRPMVDLRDEQARRTLVLLAPRALGLGAIQVIFLAVTYLASGLEPGSITVFTFAFAVYQIPLGVIGLPLGTVLLPSLAREAALGVGDAFRRLIVRGLAVLAYTMVAMAGLGIVVAPDVARLLFGGAGLSGHDMARTAATLAWLLVGLTADSLIFVLARSFYALQDTTTAVAGSLLDVVASVAVGAILVGPFGVAGLAMGMALGAWLEAIILALLLQRRVAGLVLGPVWVVMAKTTAITIAGALAAWGVELVLVGVMGADAGFIRVLVRTCAAAGVGAAVIVVGSLLLRIEELRRIVDVLGSVFRRRQRA